MPRSLRPSCIQCKGVRINIGAALCIENNARTPKGKSDFVGFRNSGNSKAAVCSQTNDQLAKCGRTMFACVTTTYLTETIKLLFVQNTTLNSKAVRITRVLRGHKSGALKFQDFQSAAWTTQAVCILPPLRMSNEGTKNQHPTRYQMRDLQMKQLD